MSKQLQAFLLALAVSATTSLAWAGNKPVSPLLPGDAVLRLPVFAQDPAPEEADDEPDEKKDEEKKPEKKDPNDVRTAIDNKDLVRTPATQRAVSKKGLWEELVDAPYFTPEVRAKKQLFHGVYDKAEAGFAGLLKKEPENLEYIAGYLEAILNRGKQADLKRFFDEYAKLPEATRQNIRLVNLNAEALQLKGKLADARAALKAVVDKNPKLSVTDVPVLKAYCLYAQVLELQANYPAAAATYEKIADLALGDLGESPEVQTLVTHAVHRAGVLTGKGKDIHKSVLETLGRITNNNANYWPAHLAVAELLLTHHNAQDGGKAVNDTLSLNPNALEARFLAFEYATATYNFDNARAQLTELKNRSESAEVDAAEGRLILKERQPDQAIAPLLKSIDKNPALPSTRGWLAAAYYLTNQKDKALEQLNAVTADDGSAHPVVLQEYGEVLRDARQFAEAEKYYTQAAAKAPWWSEPYAALAQLYLEVGQYDKARLAYDKSFTIDPFNMRAFNQLKLLEQLEGFETLKSANKIGPNNDMPTFIIRYDKQDEILAKLALEYLDSIRAEIWSYYKVDSVKTSTIIEFFPSHEQFGVRTTGLPWIGTVGASTGNVIAMDVPRGGAKDMMGAFDWARVLRHEYVHTVTLDMTGNRIPHWLTEAAAVNQEQAPRDWSDAQLLASNYRAGTLFKIDGLTWGFIRPKRTIDRRLAYMQSAWLYQYLKQTYGHDKMIEFLNAFREGQREAQAFEKVYGKKVDDLNKDFLTWAGKEIESWGLPADPLPKVTDLEAAIKKDEKDIEPRIKLAWVQVSSGRVAEAEKQLRKVLELAPDNVSAGELLGAVLNQQKKRDEAKKFLEGVIAKDDKRALALRTLGLIAMSERNFDAAEKWLTRLQQVRPLESTSYVNLAGIYLIRKDNPKAIAQLSVLQQHEQKDERIPRRLADLYRAEGKLAEAENSAYRAIRINPYNAVNHQLYAQILNARGNNARAVQFWEKATDLQPKVSEFWAGLADTQAALGDKAAAKAAAEKAVELQPNSPAKKYIEP